MSKTNYQILKAFIKSNKVRRQRMAELAGYRTADEYREYLLRASLVEVQEPTPVAAPKIITGEKPTIHIVSILDASSSMYGGKFSNALQGIQKEIEELKSNTEINYLVTFVTFATRGALRIVHDKIPVSKIESIPAYCHGNTALYDAIGHILTKVKIETRPEEKVLISIFTDGDENDSREWSKRNVADLIKECEIKGFTITFVGTDRDVKVVVRDLNIKDSNTLVHDNTSHGVADSFKTRSVATRSYSSKVLKNEDVLTGFYKQEGTL
jgi:uncharacterized protein YegL